MEVFERTPDPRLRVVMQSLVKHLHAFIREVEPSDEEFGKYWNGKCLPQVAELIERYQPEMFWFDSWGQGAKNQVTAPRRDQLIKLKTDMERLRMLEKPKQDLQLMRLWSELEKLKKDLWEKDLTAEELVNLTSFLQYQVEKNLPEIDILVVLPAQHRILGKDKCVLKGVYESMENNNICLIVFIKNAANLGH